MNRNFRLTQSTDFERVRRFGKSYAHPFLVLVALPAEGQKTLIGVTATRSLGGAFKRNRAKRLVREAVRPLLPGIIPGWKVVLICRSPVLDATFVDLCMCLKELFTRAQLLEISNG